MPAGGAVKPRRGDRIGVHGGRAWHLASGEAMRRESGVYAPSTLCGKPGDENWRPGPRNPALDLRPLPARRRLPALTRRDPTMPTPTARRTRARRAAPAVPLDPGPLHSPVAHAHDERVWQAPPGATAGVVLAHNAGSPRLGPATELCVRRGMTMTLEEYRRETSCP